MVTTKTFLFFSTSGDFTKSIPIHLFHKTKGFVRVFHQFLKKETVVWLFFIFKASTKLKDLIAKSQVISLLSFLTIQQTLDIIGNPLKQINRIEHCFH